MKASDLFVRCLENEGVEYIFGVPGEENADMMISLLDSPINFIVCRHEQAAAFMADAYGRLTGKPAVCLGTLGPGATNLLTGVADANMDRAPLVVITGQGSTSRLHKESHQAMDVVSMFKPVVKWNNTITNADSIPEVVRKAFKLAVTEKMGATHIELPEDVAKHRTLAQPLRKETSERAVGNPAQIQQVVDALSNAKSPVILAGNGVLRDNASGDLTQLVDKVGIPVLNTFMGKGAIPASHPYCLYTVGLQSRDLMAQVLEEADVVCVIGYDMVEYHPKAWNRGVDKTIINIDFEPAEVDTHYLPEIEITADIGLVLQDLTEAMPDKKLVTEESFAELRDAMQAEFSEHASDTSFPVKPQKILWDVREVMDDADILLSDVGAHKMWIARQYQCDGPNTCLISNGFCTMGFALPGAVGAKIAYPEQKVMAICGDGGFMMNVQDLETAVRLKLPMVIMIWNDSQYGLIRWKQEAQFGKNSHIDFTNPDFIKLADAFGCPSKRVEKTEDLKNILVEAFNTAEEQSLPYLIDCPVDYDENMKLSRRLGELSAAQRTSWFRRTKLFSKCCGESLEVLAELMEERAFRPGETLCTQGEIGQEVYIIVSGEACGESDTATGKQTFTVGPGECVGEMSILAEQPRAATVVAGSEGAETLVLDSGEFHEVLLSQPQIAMELLSVLSQRVVEGK